MRALAGFGLLLLAPVWLAAETVRIEEIGLQGYYAQAPHPTRIRVWVANPLPEPQSLTLQIQIVAQVSEQLDRTDRFSQTISLRPGESRSMDIPVLISWFTIGYSHAEEMFLVAELRDAAGNLLGRSRQELNYPVYDAVVAILCDQEKVCQNAQTQISFSGTAEEQTRKGRDLKFVAVREPPAVWFAYASAHTVVLARRPAGLAPAAREALEEYLRLGGRLLLLEEEAAAAGFLSPYRAGRPAGNPQWVGRGRLIRLAGLRDRQLGDLFTGEALERLLEARWRLPLQFGATELSYARSRLATSFVLPGLGWLLAWLGAYILLVGVVNFTLLNRLKRREWGWITVPAVAVGFAVFLYTASAAQRPREFRADEVALYWMDDRSSLAAAEIGVRVSAPGRATVTLSVPTDSIFSGEPKPSIFSTFMNLVSTPEPQLGRDVGLGPPRQLELSLLQWSFQDFEFRGVRRMPGTVAREGSRLRNTTGQHFRDALYVDKDKVYFLGEVGAGAEVDLTAVRQEPLAQQTGRMLYIRYPIGLSGEDPTEGYSRRSQKPEDPMREWEEWRQLPRQPFQLVELIRGWPSDGGHVFEQRAGLFFGLAEEPVAGAQLAPVSFSRKNFALTIVSFGPRQ